MVLANLEAWQARPPNPLPLLLQRAYATLWRSAYSGLVNFINSNGSIRVKILRRDCMPEIQRRALTRAVWTVLMAVFVWAAGASTGAAQFRLPKVPGNSNKETKPSQSGSPEVSTVSPDSAPPGGH